MAISPLTNYYLFQIVRYLWIIVGFLWLHPFAVVFGAGFIFDTPDLEFFVLTGKSREFYDRTDKLADLAFHIAAGIYYTYFWKQLWYARIIAPFFWWRVIGNIIFLITLEGWALIVFPNVGEILMWFFSILDYGLPRPLPGKRFDRWWKRKKGWTVIAVIIIIIGKTISEYFLWRDTPKPIPPPTCNSVGECWGLISPGILAFLVFGILASYYYPAHFYENTVRLNKAGIVVKTKKPPPPQKVFETLADAIY